MIVSCITHTPAPNVNGEWRADVRLALAPRFNAYSTRALFEHFAGIAAKHGIPPRNFRIDRLERVYIDEERLAITFEIIATGDPQPVFVDLADLQ